MPAPEPRGHYSGPWPTGASRNDSGELEISGVPVSELAAAYGTPAYVIDLDDLSARAKAWAQACISHLSPKAGMAGGEIYYAGKAFLSLAVAKLVASHGLGVDCASGGELTVALRAGVPPARIGLHGNNKSDDEIDQAVRGGVGRLVADSLHEIERLKAFGQENLRAGRPPIPVMIRVTTGVHAGGHSYIATAHEDQKFGISIASGEALAAAREVHGAPGLDLIGIHSHIGSQIFDLDAFAHAARAVVGLMKTIEEEIGEPIREVDLGGGFPVRYTDADPIPPSPDEVVRQLAGHIREACQAESVAVPLISFEPGRSVIAPAGITLYTVGTIKDQVIGEGKVRRYVSVDGGMSDNIRPALYDARYTALLANREGPARDDLEGWTLSRVVGKHCESGDIVVHDVLLPADLRAGDLLAVPTTGAYGRAMASNYNMMARPPVIGVSGGQMRMLVRGESVNDLLRLDQG